MAIVVPNGEALWITVGSLDENTPRLVLPWSWVADPYAACNPGAESVWQQRLFQYPKGANHPVF